VGKNISISTLLSTGGWRRRTNPEFAAKIGRTANKIVWK